MRVSVHQPQYLPWLGYFDKIARSDCFVFLDDVQYKHREFQNRNKIRTKEGWIWLTVPVITKGLRDQKIKDVLIDNETDWQSRHLNSIKSCYGKSKYFDRYAGFFEDVLGKRQWERLIDLNVFITGYIMNELGIETLIHFESQLGTTKTSTARIIEICKKLNADIYLSGSGGKVYLEQEQFEQALIRLEYQEFVHPRYQQVFGGKKQEFVPCLSIIDLLFNEGPESRKILLRG
ncbi:MAG: WbqC family protein [Candidatus Omnitrophica bacterium]|nr:WbqC family protein [Candidatus Omnitrophota bacterium]